VRRLMQGKDDVADGALAKVPAERR
jgi:hypothetical protein